MAKKRLLESEVVYDIKIRLGCSIFKAGVAHFNAKAT